MSKHFSAAPILLLALVLGGCSLAPTYHRPDAPVAERWSADTSPQAVVGHAPDWQAFIIDPELRRLVGIALTNNRSLRQSLLDIEQARAQYRIQRADRVPDLSGAASGSRQRGPSDLTLAGSSTVSSSY